MPNKSNTDFISRVLYHAKNYLIASISNILLGVIAIPIYTRLLSPEEYGVYSVFISYVGILSVILSLNIHASIGRYWFENSDDFKKFSGTCFSLMSIILILSSLSFIFFKEFFGNLMRIPVSLIIWLIPFVIVEITYSTFRQIFEPQKESAIIAKVSIYKAYTSFILSIILILIYKNDRYMGIILGYALSGISLSLFLIFKLKKYFSIFTFDKKYLNYIFLYSIPYIPYSLSGFILGQFDRIMINGYVGEKAAGIYSLSYSIGAMLSVVSVALLNAWTPDFFKIIDNKDLNKYNNDIKKMFTIILIVALCIMFYGIEFGYILADKKYHEALFIIPYIVFGYIFDAIWGITARNYAYKKNTHWLSIIGITAGFVKIVLNMVFIPKYGYITGVYTTAISFAFMAVFGVIVNKYFIKMYTYPFIKFIEEILYLVFVYFISYILIKLFSPNILISMVIKTILLIIYSLFVLYRIKLLDKNIHELYTLITSVLKK
ncbi:MAG: hypothetical protein A2X12_06010 [Bacteroidetes bacterium GWE2_29_8]|nr:MAG: hypothetical protein A2X12_06010 [Bacteroidetes bacterium GWE2_29_8]OFY20051.1 MAG: hypothetical protein A2X02_06710 [Bacteroidetes bacterium GWF2_29_10]